MKPLEKALVIDIDIIIAGEHWHAFTAFVETVRQQDKTVRFVSQDTCFGRRALTRQLQDWGLSLKEDELFCASYVLGRELARRDNRATVFVLGTDGLKEDLQQQGCRVIEQPEEIGYLADYVVVGYDPAMSFDRLHRALQCLQHGAKWALPDNRVTLPPLGSPLRPTDVEPLPAPGPGAVAHMVRALADDTKPGIQLGVPRPHILLHALRSTEIEAEQWAYVGDVDGLEAAKNAGTATQMTADALFAPTSSPAGRS